MYVRNSQRTKKTKGLDPLVLHQCNGIILLYISRARFKAGVNWGSFIEISLAVLMYTT